MTTSAAEIAREISIKISRDLEVRKKVGEFAEQVVAHAKIEWKEAALSISAPPTHPYETGEFEDSIHAEKRRDHLGHWPHWEVLSDDPKANMLEYGTGPDKPGSRSPWGPYTPTPEFAIFAKTAHHFKGTADD